MTIEQALVQHDRIRQEIKTPPRPIWVRPATIQSRVETTISTPDLRKFETYFCEKTQVYRARLRDI